MIIDICIYIYLYNDIYTCLLYIYSCTHFHKNICIYVHAYIFITIKNLDKVYYKRRSSIENNFCCNSGKTLD